MKTVSTAELIKEIMRQQREEDAKWRMFRFQDLNAGKRGSDKFWCCRIEGNIFYAKWGRRGYDGEEDSWTFSSESAASYRMNEKIREKMRKGYAEVTSL